MQVATDQYWAGNSQITDGETLCARHSHHVWKCLCKLCSLWIDDSICISLDGKAGLIRFNWIAGTSTRSEDLDALSSTSPNFLIQLDRHVKPLLLTNNALEDGIYLSTVRRAQVFEVHLNKECCHEPTKALQTLLSLHYRSEVYSH